MDEPLVLGIDAGTTSVRCIAWDLRGQAVAEGRSAEIPLLTVGPDGFEQDPLAWWDALGQAARELATHIDAKRLRAAAIAQQRETFALCDPGGAPLRPAIVWMDERAWAEVEATRQGPLGPHLHAWTGKPACLTPSLYKLLWLRAHEPARFQEDVRVTDVHGFLTFCLTGAWKTSLPSADPMGLLDIEHGHWRPELLKLVGLRSANFPALCAPGAPMARLHAQAAAHTGLPEGLPLIAGAGDGQAAALGAGLRGPHEIYLNLGTAIVSGVVSAAPRRDPAFRTLFGAAPGTWLLETDLKGGCLLFSWLVRRWLDPHADEARKARWLAQLADEASRLPPGAEGLLLVPYWCGVMNPYWDDNAAGLVVGWRERHGPAHLYRAILEGIALEQRLHTQGVASATQTPIEQIVVLGGGSRSELWCQILASVTQTPVTRAGHAEATSLGAAILAALGAGCFEDAPRAVSAMTSRAETFLPGPEAPHYDALFAQVYQHLYPALQGPLADLARLARSAGSA